MRDSSPTCSHTGAGWWLVVALGVVCLAIVATFSIARLGSEALLSAAR